MAGFLKRVRRLTMAKINAFLDGAEKPEEIFPRLVQEMREEGKKAVEAEATAVAALRRREQDHSEAKGDVEKWSGRAELAVKDGNDDLARKALERQVAAEKRLAAAEDSLQVARQAAEQAREAREDLHNNLETLERKRTEILARARAAKQQGEVQKVLAGIESGGGGSILDAVARMEEKVAQAEAKAEAYGDVASEKRHDDLEVEFRKLERKQSIEERLAELKEKVGGKSGPAADKAADD